MKRLALLIPVFLLSGCLATAPVVPKWPEVPKEMLEACPDLKTVDPANDKLSTVIDTVADNYKQYYDCKAQVDSWIMWYKGQQEIWKTLK
jgi:hypothetical protein